MKSFKEVLIPVSPELAKKDRKMLSDTFKVAIDTLNLLRTWGTYTTESLALAGQTLAKELLDITLVIDEEPAVEEPVDNEIPLDNVSPTAEDKQQEGENA